MAESMGKDVEDIVTHAVSKALDEFLDFFQTPESSEYADGRYHRLEKRFFELESHFVRLSDQFTPLSEDT